MSENHRRCIYDVICTNENFNGAPCDYRSLNHTVSVKGAAKRPCPDLKTLSCPTCGQKTLVPRDDTPQYAL